MLKPDEIIEFINEDKTSKRKNFARLGERYYEGEHDIKNRRIFYFNSDGELVEDKTRSNVKISHPFFTELVDQCVHYMLSSEENCVHSDIPELQEKMDAYFDEEFYSEFADTLTDTCIAGFGYMYAYKSMDDRVKFCWADEMGVVEVKARDASDSKDHIIYWYIDKIEKGSRKIKRIEDWDDEQTYYYIQEDDKGLQFDEDVLINPRPHIVYTKDNDNSIYYDAFGFVPFFRLETNRKQTSHLKPIKDIIDDYDVMNCGLSNNLADFDNPIYIVSGFKGDNLDELQQNLKTKKAIGVGENGGVDVQTVEIPYQARKEKMDVDRENIYKFGMGFDSSKVGDGNITNIVILSRYALLELKCNKLEKKVKAFLKKLVKVVLEEINKSDGTDYTLKDIKISIKREMMTNASDNAAIEKTKAETVQIKVNTLLNAAAQLDNETLLRTLCELLELKYDEVKSKLLNNSQNDINQAGDTNCMNREE